MLNKIRPTVLYSLSSKTFYNLHQLQFDSLLYIYFSLTAFALTVFYLLHYFLLLSDWSENKLHYGLSKCSQRFKYYFLNKRKLCKIEQNTSHIK